MNELLKPLKDTTNVSEDKSEWRPKTFSDFLNELHHIVANTPDVCFFRGQRCSDRLLDSTFARKMKMQRGYSVTERYPDNLRASTAFQYELAGDLLNYLDKVPVLAPFLHNQLPGILIGSQTIDLLYQYHVHLQQEPNDSNLIAYASLGTNFLDFTYDQNVGIFFANQKRLEADAGALFIIRQRALGKVFHKGDTPFQDLLIRLRSEVARPCQEGYKGLPRLPWPIAQVRPEKVKRQNALYVAQMDFRFDLELSWKQLQQQTQKRVFIKLILPPGTCEEVQQFLLAEGVTENFLFPSRI